MADNKQTPTLQFHFRRFFPVIEYWGLVRCWEAQVKSVRISCFDGIQGVSSRCMKSF